MRLFTSLLNLLKVELQQDYEVGDWSVHKRVQHRHVDVEISTGKNKWLALNDDLREDYLNLNNKKNARVKKWFNETDSKPSLPHRTPTSALWLMLSKASCEYAKLKRVVQSEMALFVDSVLRHKENMPRADSRTHCTFSISWKIVKLFIVSMKKVQNALRVKNRKIVPAKKSELMASIEFKILNVRQKVENHFASLIF